MSLTVLFTSDISFCFCIQCVCSLGEVQQTEDKFKCTTQEPTRAETTLYLIVGNEASITNCKQFVTFCVAACRILWIRGAEPCFIPLWVRRKSTNINEMTNAKPICVKPESDPRGEHLTWKTCLGFIRPVFSENIDVRKQILEQYEKVKENCWNLVMYRKSIAGDWFHTGSDYANSNPVTYNRNHHVTSEQIRRNGRVLLNH